MNIGQRIVSIITNPLPKINPQGTNENNKPISLADAIRLTLTSQTINNPQISNLRNQQEGLAMANRDV